MPVHGVGGATLTRPTTAKPSCRCMVSGALRLPDLQRPNCHAGAWCRVRYAYPTYNGQTVMPVHGVGCATLTRPTTAKPSCRCMVSGALRLPDLQRPNHHVRRTVPCGAVFTRRPGKRSAPGIILALSKSAAAARRAEDRACVSRRTARRRVRLCVRSLRQ
ncbi:hypothetical protein DFQ50_103176 [Pseudocitrobacter faecalis]|uniref:Uncharacterized protein n=1 Tax=Pseudocitrobacter faecalis TaxID=1398493 RepID=A0ABX9FYT0_9ENTR|nr:hypothetical protein DFQ50_103176 [Pseudocitrobacter faecalis]